MVKVNVDCPGSFVDQNFFPVACTMPVQCTVTRCPARGFAPVPLLWKSIRSPSAAEAPAAMLRVRQNGSLELVFLLVVGVEGRA